MFIYQFNRLIRSRLLWGFFAIIISVAFVSVGSCGRSPTGPSVAGKMNGKKISASTYEQADIAVRGFGNRRNNNMSAKEANRKIWEQVAALQVATKNGLTASTEDVRNVIRGMRDFQGSNGFDFKAYRNILRREGFSSEAQYENLVGHSIMMNKIGTLIDSATWISPMELDDEIAAMTDKFTVQTVALSNRFADVEMRLSDEDYKKFYEEHNASFRRPDRMSVRYIAIPVSNYLARVTVPDDDMLDHYEKHMDKYSSSDTNNVISVKPFEEVKEEILAELLLEEAQYCVETNVTFAIFGKLSKAADTALATLAAEEQVEVVTSPLFSQHEPLPWTSNTREFASAAFELDPENSETRFAVAKGKNEIFVMEYLQKSETYIPAFEDVAEDVKKRAQEKARVDAFDRYTKEIRTDLSKLMETGKTFADAATEMALNVSTSLTYTASDMQTKPFENCYAIAYGARTLKKGELSEAVQSSMTQSMLIYVEDRQQGDALSSALMSSQIRSGLERRRGGALYNDWLKWNLDQQRFEPSPMFAGGAADDAEDELPPTLDE